MKDRRIWIFCLISAESEILLNFRDSAESVCRRQMINQYHMIWYFVSHWLIWWVNPRFCQDFSLSFSWKFYENWYMKRRNYLSYTKSYIVFTYCVIYVIQSVKNSGSMNDTIKQHSNTSKWIEYERLQQILFHASSIMASKTIEFKYV